MKKILSLLATINLIGTSTTSLVACDNHPDINKNKEDDKIEHNTYKPQKPPLGSNWKLIDRDNFVNENSEKNNKWYILIAKLMQSDNFSIIKFNFSSELIWKVGEYGGHRINSRWYVYINSLYRWDGNGEPETPKINKDTGEIIIWK